MLLSVAVKVISRIFGKLDPSSFVLSLRHFADPELAIVAAAEALQGKDASKLASHLLEEVKQKDTNSERTREVISHFRSMILLLDSGHQSIRPLFERGEEAVREQIFRISLFANLPPSVTLDVLIEFLRKQEGVENQTGPIFATLALFGHKWIHQLVDRIESAEESEMVSWLLSEVLGQWCIAETQAFQDGDDGDIQTGPFTATEEVGPTTKRCRPWVWKLIPRPAVASRKASSDFETRVCVQWYQTEASKRVPPSPFLMLPERVSGISEGKWVVRMRNQSLMVAIQLRFPKILHAIGIARGQHLLLLGRCLENSVGYDLAIRMVHDLAPTIKDFVMAEGAMVVLLNAESAGFGGWRVLRGIWSLVQAVPDSSDLPLTWYVFRERRWKDLLTLASSEHAKSSENGRSFNSHCSETKPIKEVLGGSSDICPFAEALYTFSTFPWFGSDESMTLMCSRISDGVIKSFSLEESRLLYVALIGLLWLLEYDLDSVPVQALFEGVRALGLEYPGTDDQSGTIVDNLPFLATRVSEEKMQWIQRHLGRLGSSMDFRNTNSVVDSFVNWWNDIELERHLESCWRASGSERLSAESPHSKASRIMVKIRDSLASHTDGSYSFDNIQWLKVFEDSAPFTVFRQYLRFGL